MEETRLPEHAAPLAGPAQGWAELLGLFASW